jgi:twitching motility protein PilT
MYSMMQTGQSKFGMLTMNQSLYELYTKGIITYEDALGRSPIPEEFLNMVQGAVQSTSSRERSRPGVSGKRRY